MTTLHLNTETGHQTASTLRQSAVTAMEEVQSLRRAVQNLEVTWQGNAQMEFTSGMNSISMQLQTQIESLQMIVERLDREVIQWEEVDRRGSSMFQGNRMNISFLMPPLTGGGWSSDSVQNFFAPLMTSVSIAPFLANLPPWLSKFLDSLFPPKEIISPIPDTLEPPESGTTPLGELLKKPPTQTPPVEPAPEPPQQPAQPEVPPTATPSAQPNTSPANGYDVSYDIPAKSQGALYGSAACLPTSMSMVTDYYHAKDASLQAVTPKQLVDMLDPGDGTSTGSSPGIGLDRLNDDLAEIGYQSNVQPGSMDDLTSKLKEGPVIINAGVSLISNPARDIQNAGSVNHAMLVKAINNDSVVLNDPWSGMEKTFTRATFEKMWKNGQNYMIIVRPGTAQ